MHLLSVLQITNFGLHYSISGGGGESEVCLKTTEELMANDMARESIKYVYGIYVNILDFILKLLFQGLITIL